MIGCRHHGTSVSGFRRGRPNNPASFGRWTCSRTADDPAATEAAFSNRVARLRRCDASRRRRLLLFPRAQEADHRPRRLEHCPQEVEDALLAHPSVASAGVIGIHDLVHGENVRAYITLTEGTE